MIKLTDSQKKFLDLIKIADKPNATTQELMDADIKAMKIYLSMGYSISDAKKAFELTFSNPTSDRYKLIEEYLKRL